VNGIFSVLKLRPEIKAIVERGSATVEEFDPSPSLWHVAVYYEYRDLCNSKLATSIDLGNKCRGVAEVEKKFEIFVDPGKFFERTYLTDNMDDVIVKVFSGLLNVKGRGKHGALTLNSRVIFLPSLMGGGKTHLLITLFHIMRLYNKHVVEERNVDAFEKAVSKLSADLARRLHEMINETGSKGLKRIRIVAIDGPSEETTPDPGKPKSKVYVVPTAGMLSVNTYTVRTIWGSIAHYLGRYQDIKHRDESDTVPSLEELKQVLADGPFLIIIDEVHLYADRYGDADKLRDFFQVLALAIKEVGNGVMIISIPLAVEELSSGEGVASKIYQAVARSQANLEIIPPLKAPDLVSVLKRRLFENGEDELRRIGCEVARQVISRGGDIVKKAIESIFKSAAAFEDSLAETYPFNPLYIKLLEEYFTNIKYLHRTRDALRITVRVLVDIYNGKYRWLGEDFAYISPYHIPINDQGVRSFLANPGSIDYQVLMSMYDRDVEGASKSTSMPWLSHVVASYIWLRTIVGRGVLEQQLIKFYSKASDIILTTYDPIVFTQQREGAGRILDSLKELVEVSNYLVRMGDATSMDAVYVMAQIPPIDELIKRRARNVSDTEALKRIHNLVAEAVEKEKKERKMVAKSHYLVFKDVKIRGVESRGLPLAEVQISDEPLLVIFTYEPDENELNDILRRNNVVALLPRMSIQVQHPACQSYATAKECLIGLAKELVALESIINEGDLSKLYGEEIAKLRRESLKARADKLIDDISEVLKGYVFSEMVVGVPKWRITQPVSSKLSGKSNTLVIAVEEILLEQSYIPSGYSLSKDDVVMIARRQQKTCTDEVTGTERICGEMDIGEAWHWFLTTVDPPFRHVVVSFDGFIKGIRQIYEEDLSVAFVYGDRFVWKSIRDSRPEDVADKGNWGEVGKFTREMGIDIKRLRIVPYDTVIDRFVEAVKGLEGVKVEGKVKKFVKLMVSYRDPFGSRVDEELATFLQRAGWRELIRTAVLWQHVEYPEYVFSLAAESAEVDGKKVSTDGGIVAEPGKKVMVKLKVNAKEYPYEVTVATYLDDLTVHRETVEGGTEKSITIQLESSVPGEHLVKIEASGNDPKGFKQTASILLKVPGEVSETQEADSSEKLKAIVNSQVYTKVELFSIRVRDVAKATDLVRVLKDYGLYIKHVKVHRLELRGQRSESTKLTIESGVISGYDEFKTFVDTLSKLFIFESGELRVELCGLSDKDAIWGLSENISKIGVSNVVYEIKGTKRIG